MVGRNTVDAAYRSLTRRLVSEGINDKVSRGRYFERPTKLRERIEYETCNRVYNREMKRRIQFLARKRRPKVEETNWQL